MTDCLWWCVMWGRKKGREGRKRERKKNWWGREAEWRKRRWCSFSLTFLSFHSLPFVCIFSLRLLSTADHIFLLLLSASYSLIFSINFSLLSCTIISTVMNGEKNSGDFFSFKSMEGKGEGKQFWIGYSADGNKCTGSPVRKYTGIRFSRYQGLLPFPTEGSSIETREQ